MSTTIRTLQVILIAFYCASKLNAQGTEELLRSKRVNDYIYIEPDLKNKSTEYQIDKMKNNKQYGKPFSDILSLTVSPKDKSINILVKYFNPFRNKIVLSDTLLTDDNYEALNKFFESITTLLNTISEKNPGVVPTKNPGVAGLGALDILTKIGSPLLQEWKYLFKKGSIDECLPDPEAFVTAVQDADNAFYKSDDKSFEKKVQSALDKINKANTLTKLNAAFTDCETTLPETKELNDKSKGYIAVLESEVKKLNLSDPAGKALYCGDFANYTKDVINTFINDIKDKQKSREEVQTQLESLKTSLESFLSTSTTVIVEGTPMEAVRIGTYKVDEEKVREVTMVIKERTVAFENNRILVADKADILSRKIRIRAHRVLIPEFASGLFYTNLTYKNFIANDKGTTIVVEEGKKEKASVVAAAHLNLVLDVWTDICPMLQIGVGTAKDRPSLLAGGGFRFSKPKKLSLSFGGIWTWKKELTNLSVGETIQETAQLDKDLKYNFDTKPAFYIGIQYNF